MIFRPIRNRVAVTRQNVTVSSGLSDDAIGNLPHGGMAEFLLEHAVQKSLYSWLPASTNTILPNPATPVSFEQSPSGYKLAFKIQTSDVEMVLAPRYASAERNLETTAIHRVRDIICTWAAGVPFDHIDQVSKRELRAGPPLDLHLYLPDLKWCGVARVRCRNQESHHEVWRYRLRDCIVKTTQ